MCLMCLNGVLPRLLLTDRRLTRNSHGNHVDLFMERVRQVVQLRGLDDLLARGPSSTRTLASSVPSEERTRADVLKAIRLGQYSRAGKVAMREEVARNNESAAAVADGLYPDATIPDDLPAPEVVEPLDRAIFMRNIGADGVGRVKVGSAADSAGHRWEHIEWLVAAGGAEDLYTVCNRLWMEQGSEEEDDDWSWVFNAKLVLLIKKLGAGYAEHRYAAGYL